MDEKALFHAYRATVNTPLTERMIAGDRAAFDEERTLRAVRKWRLCKVCKFVTIAVDTEQKVCRDCRAKEATNEPLR